MIIMPLPYVLIVGVREEELGVPVSVEMMQHLPVVRDNRGDSVHLTAEHGLVITAVICLHLAVELNIGLVARLLALQHQLVNKLHAQCAEEKTGTCEGGNDGVVLQLTADTAITTSSNLGRNISMLPSMEPQALLPVKWDLVQMYPFAQ